MPKPDLYVVPRDKPIQAIPPPVKETERPWRLSKWGWAIIWILAIGLWLVDWFHAGVLLTGR